MNDINWTDPWAIGVGLGCGIGYWLTDWWRHRND